MAVRLLDAATATGVGDTWNIRSGAANHTLQGTATGNPTGITTDLEGSLDGVTWYTLAAHKWVNGELTDQQAMFHVLSKYVTYVRVNLTTLTGGTSPTVTIKYDSDRN